MAISDTIESMYENTENAYDKVEEKGGTIPANKNLQNLASAIDSIVTGGGVSTQSQSIFTGYTAPLTWLNSTNNVFKYESATHNITISGLSGVATITGNGTKSVTVTIDTSSSSDRQTAFTISCVNGEQELTYNGIEFHYGSDVASGNCLAVAQTLIDGRIGYIFIESASLPSFNNNTASWNSVYSHQIISFDFGKWSGTTILSNTLHYCFLFNQPLAIPSTVITINENFLQGGSSFNQPLDIGNVTNIGQSFMCDCCSFNQPLDISNATSIGNNFLCNCYSFNQPLDIGNVTNIGQSFMCDCCSFNQPLDIGNVTSIGNNFLCNCYSFNQPLDIGNVTSIGSQFLGSCRSFNQPLNISSVTSIGDSFLYCCNSFNQPLNISSVTSIGEYFLNSCSSFNQPLTIPSGVTRIGDDFLGYCCSFNQPLTILSGVTSIGEYFLNSCSSFNQPLTIPSGVTRIGDDFLYCCNSFNQPLTIPSGVTSIGDSFLYGCNSFNQPLAIPSGVTSIGDSFLYECYSFNQPLAIPDGVTSIGGSFLYECYSLIYLEYNASVYPTDNDSLSQFFNTKTSSTGTGIKVVGTGASGLKSALPNRTSSPFRKLV